MEDDCICLNSVTIDSTRRWVLLYFVIYLHLILHYYDRVDGVHIFSDDPPFDYTAYYDQIVAAKLPTIDKSSLIEEYLKHPARVLLINRPPKWGKTSNLRMLRKFLEIELDENAAVLAPEKRVNRKYFVGGTLRLYSDQPRELKPARISRMPFSMKRQGEHPVILLNLAPTTLGDTYDEIEQRLRSEIEDIFTEHVFLEGYLDENSTVLNAADRKKLDGIVAGHYETDDLKDSLRFLSELLYMHYKRKVHVLIDDYDAPITKLFFRTYVRVKQQSMTTAEKLLESQLLEQTFASPDLRRTVELLTALYRNCLHDNDALEKALVTGTMRIAKADTFHGMHAVKEYTLMDDEFSSFYGFDQDEVDLLIKSSRGNVVEDDSKRDDLADWYGGYISAAGRKLYNVWSVTQCLLEKGRLAVYNIGNCPNDLINDAGFEVQKKILELMAGKTIIVVINKHVTFKEGVGPELFNILLATGNLTPKNFTGKGLHYMCEMAIPNLEVKNLYEGKTERIPVPPVAVVESETDDTEETEEE